MNTPIISCSQLVKRFPNAPEPVLNGIDLEIFPGESVAIMGPSGSGKSTLLYALSGIDLPTSGQVWIDGTDITGLSQKELSRLRLTKLGFVFQQSHLLSNLSLLDNVVFPGMEAGRDDAPARGRQLLAQVGLGDLADRSITQASGGQLQRVSICRALINDPAVVFCDEPTGALNSSATAEVLDLLDEVNAQGTTLVIVTHDPAVTARCQRLLFLRDGVIHDERQRTEPGELTAWLVSHGF